MKPSRSVFKAYDLRGTVPATVNDELAEALGRAFGTMAREEGERTVAVGRDGRLSSPALARSLVRGLLAAGTEVLDLGMVTTPMAWYATHTLCRSAIQVTASHNPRDDNGFKLVLAGRTVHGEELQALRRRIEDEDWRLEPGAGVLRPVAIAPSYAQRITGDTRLARPMKVVLDCGNGVGGAFAPAIFRALGCALVELYSEVDGAFPNHHPDPGDTIDGLRVDWPDGFGLVRASNTTPMLTLRFEGDTPEALRRIQQEMLALVRSVKPDARLAAHS